MTWLREVALILAAVWEFCIRGAKPFGRPMRDDDTPNYPPPIKPRIFANGSPARAFTSDEQDAGNLVHVISHDIAYGSVIYKVSVDHSQSEFECLAAAFVHPVEGSVYE